MARLDLAHPLTADQALLHVATGSTRFVRSVGGSSQLAMARAWLAGGDDALLPSDLPRERNRLVRLRDALALALDSLDETQLPGWGWVWLAKDRAPDAIHPICEANWQAFVAERTSDQPAAVLLPEDVAARSRMDTMYPLLQLVERPFDFATAINLARWGDVSPKVPPRTISWRSTGLEPEVQRALDALAKARPGLLSRSKKGKAYRSDELDRFDLYVALCRVHPALSATRYSAATILRCLTTLVACRRGRRPSAHPYHAPQTDALEVYAEDALRDEDWLRYFGFRPR